LVGQKLRIIASRDLRLVDESRTIKIADLPLLQFHWALNLLQGDLAIPEITAPTTKVVLMYMQEDFVEVEGQSVFRGVKYVDRDQLTFGEITAKQILTAQ